MRSYLNLIQQIIDTGSVKTNERTGASTVSIVGPQLRFDLREGFPLVTTKKMHLKSIIHELLWFIRGATNNTELNNVGVTIWDEWALPEAVTAQVPMIPYQRAELYAEQTRQPLRDVIVMLQTMDRDTREGKPDAVNGMTFLTNKGIPLYSETVTHAAGALGPIYGAMWRRWPNLDGSHVDQLQVCIAGLRERPFSRRHIVTAWNPTFLPSEEISPQENVLQDRQALAPCHAFFQFVANPLSLDERVALYTQQTYPDHSVADLARMTRGGDQILDIYEDQKIAANQASKVLIENRLDELRIPRAAVSLVLTQRKNNCAIYA